MLFYKRINDVYLENVAELEKELNDAELARDPRMHDFVVPEDCAWEKVARTTERDLGRELNHAILFAWYLTKIKVLGRRVSLAPFLYEMFGDQYIEILETLNSNLVA